MLRSLLVALFCSSVFSGIPDRSSTAAEMAAVQDDSKIAGILIEKKDAWITVKADGEQDAVKYVLPKGADKKLNEAFKAVFNASRVQLTYKKNGDERQLHFHYLAGHRPRILQDLPFDADHDKFWVEVKPKEGPADAYAPGLNFKDKAFMSSLNSLQPGDQVTITFGTDFERHRILSLRIDKRAK